MNQRLIGLLHRSRADALRRLARVGRHPSIDVRSGLVRIIDPDGRCAILAVQGVLDAAAIRALWIEAEQLGSITTVHLDLTDTTVLPGPWMEELEVLVDGLEDAGCDVRIAGLDPYHPDL